MKFKVDENLPIDVVDLLRSSSGDASSVFDENLIGESDDRISEVCQEEERILITLDLDFSDVRTYPPENYPGLIVLRLHKQDKPYVVNIIKKVIEMLKHEPIRNQLWIVEENRIRIRGEDERDSA